MNTESEYDQLYFPRQGQQRKLRPGYTREQAERMFARMNAVKAAEGEQYQGGMTAKGFIDDLIVGGYATFYRKGRWGYLGKDESSGYRFSKIVELDYISVVLNQGKMERNY